MTSGISTGLSRLGSRSPGPGRIAPSGGAAIALGRPASRLLAASVRFFSGPLGRWPSSRNVPKRSLGRFVLLIRRGKRRASSFCGRFAGRGELRSPGGRRRRLEPVEPPWAGNRTAARPGRRPAIVRRSRAQSSEPDSWDVSAVVGCSSSRPLHRRREAGSRREGSDSWSSPPFEADGNHFVWRSMLAALAGLATRAVRGTTAGTRGGRSQGKESAAIFSDLATSLADRHGHSGPSAPRALLERGPGRAGPGWR